MNGSFQWLCKIPLSKVIPDNIHENKLIYIPLSFFLISSQVNMEVASFQEKNICIKKIFLKLISLITRQIIYNN